MVNLNKFDKLAGVVFRNCLRLHFDAITLFNNGSYPSSFFLSVLALEEYGKTINVLDLIYFASTSEWDLEQCEKWLHNTLFHVYKQMKFASYNRNILPEKYMEMTYRGSLDIEKQNAIYVGLPRGKKKIDLGGKIINPLKIGHKKAQRQISHLNDCLLLLSLRNIKGLYFFESTSFANQLDRHLYSSLLAQWKYIGSATKKEMQRLEKEEDFEEN